MNAPITWYGGKHYMVKHLLPLIPKHVCYAEVFGGAMNLLLNKTESKVEYYNDLNSDVVNFFKVLQDKDMRAIFMESCETLLYSRELRADYFQEFKTATDPIRRAFLFFYLNRTGFSALYNKTGFGYSTTKSYSKLVLRTIDGLPEIVSRLQQVLIDNVSFEVAIERMDSEDTFFYLDPPYLPETRKHNSRDVYAHEMTLQDHERLIALISEVKGTVMLSGYDNELYNSLGWKKRQYEVQLYVSRHRTGQHRTECVWINYEPETQLMLI